MSECNECRNKDHTIRWLQRTIEDLKEELNKERKNSSDFYSIKKERDELRSSADRAYDTCVTTTKGMP